VEDQRLPERVLLGVELEQHLAGDVSRVIQGDASAYSSVGETPAA